MAKKTLHLSSIFIIGLIVLGAIGALGSGWLVFIYQDYRGIEQRLDFAERIANGSYQLTTLTGEYLIYQEPRAEEQWRNRHLSMGKILDDARARDTTESQPLQGLSHNFDRSLILFDRVVAILDASTDKKQNGPFAKFREKRLASELLSVTQSLVSQASLLAKKASMAHEKSTRRTAWVTGGLILLLTIVLLSLWSLLASRVIQPIRKLRDNIRAFGDRIDQRIETDRDDEIGNVATSFNEMIERLQATVVSRDELVQEVEERKQAEHLAQESQARLRGAIESLQEGFVLFDAEDRLVAINDVYRRINPLAQGILDKGLKFEDLIRANVKAGRRVEAFGREEEFIRERIEEHRNPKGPILRRTRDGKSYLIQEVRTPEGGIAMTFVDISELKETEKALLASEQRLQDIAEAASDWFWEMDENLRFSFFSERRADLTGLFPTENIGKTRWEVAGADPDKDEKWRAHRAMLEAHEPFRDFEYEYLSSEGGRLVASLSGKPVFDDEGNFKGYRGAATDITVRKHTEDTLRHLQKIEAVGQLTGGIAHDFNNLLHVIAGNLQMLDEDFKHDANAQKMISAAMVAAFRGGELTKQLLVFSREQSLTPEIINPNDLIIETIDILKRTISEDIMIRTALGDGLRRINVDQGLLGNAILNLAINARDAMPKGGELVIETTNVDLEQEPLGEEGGAVSGAYVAITVSDTGTGMDAETLEHVFEPFFTTKEVGKGSGMGLSMVYGFVKQSSGHVSIVSDEGKGTAVRLYFAAANVTDVDVKGTEETKPVVRGDETILVVEDDEEVRQITVAMLSRLGYGVLEAKDGPTALALLRDKGKGVDLVLSDVVMPSGMSGLELARELRRHYQDIKVLMASGYSEGVIEENELDEIKATLLRKPFEFEELAAAVRDALEQ